MAMGWLDETGSWDWNLTKADLHTLPIHRFRIHRCVNRKVEGYKSGGLNWDNCKSTFDDGQQDFINEFLRDVSEKSSHNFIYGLMTIDFSLTRWDGLNVSMRS